MIKQLYICVDSELGQEPSRIRGGEAEEVDQLLNACTTATAMIVRALVGVAVILPVITVKKIATLTLSCNIWKNLKESYNRVTILKAKMNGPMEEGEDSSGSSFEELNIINN